MQWESLTAPDFKKAARETGVCVLAAGVTEKHGDYLPLGTDFLNGHRIACLAAEKEPAVVFMPFYFGQIYEARCFPGTLSINPNLLVQLYQEVFNEIGRNGFEKIILYNAHGGNLNFLRFLCQCSLWKEKTYCIYLYVEEIGNEIKSVIETSPLHACEYETSITLANYPELVKTDRIPEKPVMASGRMNDIPGTYTGIKWYSDFPEHYTGHAKLATAGKGQKLMELQVDKLAQYIAKVKSDKAVKTLNREFFSRVETLNDNTDSSGR